MFNVFSIILFFLITNIYVAESHGSDTDTEDQPPSSPVRRTSLVSSPYCVCALAGDCFFVGASPISACYYESCTPEEDRLFAGALNGSVSFCQHYTDDTQYCGCVTCCCKPWLRVGKELQEIFTPGPEVEPYPTICSLIPPIFSTTYGLLMCLPQLCSLPFCGRSCVTKRTMMESKRLFGPCAFSDCSP